MAEKDIQQYENMSEAQLGSVFFSEGVQKGASYFVQLLRSYRIAANVAHSAWKLVQEMEEMGTGTPTIETFEELKARLRLFAPQAPAFRQPQPVVEYGCRMLEELYDHLSQWNEPPYSTGVLMEQLFRRIDAMRKEMAR